MYNSKGPMSKGFKSGVRAGSQPRTVNLAQAKLVKGGKAFKKEAPLSKNDKMDKLKSKPKKK